MSFDFYPDGKYNQAVPTIEDILGYSIGNRITSCGDIERYLGILVEKSDRLQLHSYGKTYEGRNLYYLVISSPENLARIDKIRQNIKLLADPRNMKDDLESIIKETPAITWIGCNVHGGEHSSGESSMLTAYQLAAGEDEATLEILKNTIVIIDPVQNPDGRERSINYFYSSFGLKPNPDPNAAEHNMPWPGGRTNHYHFDLNRDWYPLTQMESQAKVKAYLEWNPQVYADLHEMGHNSTFYFPPPRTPINFNTPEIIRKWWGIFGQENARMFDKMGFEYYIREDFDAHYPGYGESWPTFVGAIGMTYEEASARGLSIKREDDTILSFRDAIWHHFIASMSTCHTTAKHKDECLRDFHTFYKTAIEEGINGTIKEFLIIPDSGDVDRFLNKLMLHGIEVRVSEAEFENPETRDYISNSLNEQKFPKGTYIIRMDQPKKRLIQTIFEKEDKLEDDFVKEQIQRKKDKLSVEIYDITAWSLPLAYGLNVYWSGKYSQVNSSVIKRATKRGGLTEIAKSAYLLKYDSNAAIKCAVQMLQEGYKVHVAKKPFKIRIASTDEIGDYKRGTLIFKVKGNNEDLYKRLKGIADAEGLRVDPVNTQWVEEGINLGSNNVVYLKKPKIAVLYDEPVSAESYGWMAYLFEQVYGVDFTAVRYGISSRAMNDYNVIILPNGSEGDYNKFIGEDGAKRLRTWISAGGTLVMIKGAAAFAARKGIELTTSSLVKDLRKKDDGTKPEAEKKEGEKPKEEDIPDEFKPSHIPGAVLKVKLDQTHFLSYGYGECANVLMNSSMVFYPSSKGRNVATFVEKESLQISGLVWDEMLEVLPDKAYLIDERVGEGHIILYAEDPNFRAYWDGLNRMFFNSILFGPSLGR